MRSELSLNQGVGEGEIIANYTQYVVGEVQTFRILTIKRPPLYSLESITVQPQDRPSFFECLEENPLKKVF